MPKRPAARRGPAPLRRPAAVRKAQLKRPARSQESQYKHVNELTHDGPAWSQDDAEKHIREWAGNGPKYVKLGMSKRKRKWGTVDWRFWCLSCTRCTWSGWATYKPAKRKLSIRCTPSSHHTDLERSLGEKVSIETADFISFGLVFLAHAIQNYSPNE